MSLTVQGGKLVLRNGALGTGQACCCVRECCTCGCPGGFQVRVNGMPVNASGCTAPVPMTDAWRYPSATSVGWSRFGYVTVSRPDDYWPGNAYPPDYPLKGYGFYDNLGRDNWSQWVGSASYCLACVNGELLLALSVLAQGGWGFGGWSVYDIYYQITPGGSCEGTLSATQIAPPEGAVDNNIDPIIWPIGGIIRNGIVYRGGDFYDEDGNFAIAGEFDPSQVSVEIECNPSGVCYYAENQCYGWGQPWNGDTGSFGGGPYDYDGLSVLQRNCEASGGTWDADARCEWNPCGCAACDCAQGASGLDCPACQYNSYCCDSCCELGCYGAENEVIGGIAIVTPNTAKGAYRNGFAAGCNRVGSPGQSPFPLPSNSIQYCTVSEECPEGYAAVSAQVRIYDTDGNILAERGAICCPSEVAADPCADNPAP